MQIPRFIPKLIFQIIALVLLVTCLFMTVYWIVTDTGLYRQLDGVFGGRSKAFAMLSTFLIMFTGWIVVIVPIRKLSKMPTTKEELGAGIGDGLPEVMAGIARVYEAENAKNERMYRAREYSEEMIQQARRVGVGFVIVGVVLSLAGVWMIAITAETGYVMGLQVMLLIFGPAMAIIGLVQVITGKSVVR